MCWQQRVDDDHLSLVAGLRRAKAETLIATGVTTLEQLGDLAPATLAGRLPPDANADSFEGARHQAELQLRGRREDRYLFELLPDEEERGFRLLPAPDAGDVWFDMEGHPFYETSRGLEYLFGYCFRNDDGEVVYDAVWGRDRDDERIAFEQFVDWVVARRAQHPGMHVYHYAAYERSALTRLAGQHGTREQEVDDFLRQEVLVDLYRIVKQSLRASTDSYSIKAIEKLYGFERTAEVSGGDESVVRFEEWVETGDDSILEEVERYNEEDCRSTYELHEWLRSIRPATVPWRLPPDQRPPTEEAEERDAAREALKARLLDGAEEGEPRRLLANLLDYHQREARPEWWAWFRWPQLDDDELVRDRTAIGGLEWDGNPPEVEGQSHAYRMAFPPQEHKISGTAFDPRTRASFRVRVDDDNGIVTVLRGVNRVEEPLPEGLTPGAPIPNWVIREALLRFARAYADGDEAAYPALAALLERRAPDALLAADPVTAALSLGASYLFVQGPPGSGKTWQGARMAVALMRQGKRVGVTSLSHKAIHNLLRAIQHEADAQGFTFRGVKRGKDETESGSEFSSRCIVTSNDKADILDPAIDLIGGTGWAFTLPELDIHESERPLDVLFVDEAGQLSLADVLAAGTSAHSLILLGDPNQLPQVSQGSHPEGSGRLGAAAPPPGSPDHSARPRALPRRDVAPAARAVRLHLERVLRGSARARARDRAAVACRRRRPGLARCPARAPEPVVGGRGGRRRGCRRRARRLSVHRRRRRDPAAASGRGARRRALQRPGADAALATARRPSPSARSTSSRASRRRSSSSRWRARRPTRHRAASASPSTATASTSRPRAPSAAPCSRVLRRCSTPTARRSSRCGSSAPCAGSWSWRRPNEACCRGGRSLARSASARRRTDQAVAVALGCHATEMLNSTPA